MTELKIRIFLPYNNFKRILWADSCGHDFGWPPMKKKETKDQYLARCAREKENFAGADILWNSWVKNVVSHNYYSGENHGDGGKAHVPWGTDTRDKTVFKTKIVDKYFQHSPAALTQLNICEAPPDGSYKIVSTYSGGLTNRKNMLCSIMSSVDRNNFKGETAWSCKVADGAKKINPDKRLHLEFFDSLHAAHAYCEVQYGGTVDAPAVRLQLHGLPAVEGVSLSSAGEMTKAVKAICKELNRLRAAMYSPTQITDMTRSLPSVEEYEKKIEFEFLKKFMADNGQMWGTFMTHTDASGGPYPICIDEGDFSGFLNWYYMIDGCAGIITNDEYASKLLVGSQLLGNDASWKVPVWSSPANEFLLPICVSITLEGSYYTTEDGKDALDRIKRLALEKANVVENDLYKLILAGEVVNAVQAQVDSKENLGRIWVKIVPRGTAVEQNITVDSVESDEFHLPSIVNDKEEVIEHLVNVVAHFHLRNSTSHTLTRQEIQTMGTHLPDEEQEALSQLFANRLAAMGIAGKNNFKKKIPKKQTKKQPKKKNEKQPKKKPEKQPKKQPKKKTKKKPKKQT